MYTGDGWMTKKEKKTSRKEKAIKSAQKSMF